MHFDGWIALGPYTLAWVRTLFLVGVLFLLGVV